MESRIRERLAPLAPETFELLDESGQHVGHAGAAGGGGHYRLTVVSAQFTGKNRVTRHRMVYDALQPLMQHDIHALALVTRAPGEP
ncbi:MAG TPA: BolA family protein [Burkholderiales bacterium]